MQDQTDKGAIGNGTSAPEAAPGQSPSPLRSAAPSRVAVLGAGLMGHAIAYSFAAAGSSVRVFDSVPGALSALPQRLAQCEADLGPVRGTVEPMSDLAQAVEDADLVVEAVIEDLDAKRSLLKKAAMINRRAILATNTSVIPIGAIGDGLGDDAVRLVGTHWWNPAHLIAIVEVVPTPRTLPDIAGRVMDWLGSIGKTPVLVNKDVPGFIGNRLQFAMWREALNLVEEGICDPQTVDLVVRETFGRRLAVIGPMENADFIGLELTQSIMGYVLPSLSKADQSPAVINDKVGMGQLGAKSGQGLLEWRDGDAASTSLRLRRHLLAQRQPDRTTELRTDKDAG